MAHRIWSSVIVGALSALALLLASGSALAEPASNGATIYDYDYCQPTGENSTLCASGRSIFGGTTTPSGNSTVTYHNAGTATFSQPGCTSTNTSRENTTYTFGPNATRAYHGTARSDVSFSCFGTNVTCELFSVFTLANQEVRVNRTYSTCP